MKIITGENMRKLDRKVINECKINSLTLMENAGKSVTDFLLEHFPDLKKKRICILCGRGNNGGDGFVVARLLNKRKVKVKIFLIANKHDIEGDARTNLNRLVKDKMQLSEVSEIKKFEGVKKELSSYDIIVDALLGTGFKGVVSGLFAEVINYVNSLNAVVVSIDLPSGLNVDDGQVIGPCIKADYTVTLGLIKVGLVVYPGANYCGKVLVKDIGIPEKLVNAEKTPLNFIVKEEITSMFPERAEDVNKGTVGKVVVVGGSVGLTGALYMAGLSALRSGCGLVTLAFSQSLYNIIACKSTELISKPLPENSNKALGAKAEEDIIRLCETHDALALGPGLGRDKETARLVKNLINRVKIPVVLDADGLNLISDNVDILKNKKASFVLTPHPGEMSRLTRMNLEDVQKNRIEVASKFAKKYNVILVLKGARTVVADPSGEIFINSTGNSGLASAGTGDVLTGMIASFLARGGTALNSAIIGVFLHGLAGDLAKDDKGECGMIAGDVIDNIPYAIKKVLE